MMRTSTSPSVKTVHLLLKEFQMTKTNYLEGAVRAELRSVPSLRRNHVRVSEQDGTIILSGSVSSENERDAAERAAARVSGIKAIVQELDVARSGHQKAADELLAENAVVQLSRDKDIPADSVKIEVLNGSVTLLGRVSREFQRAAAERIVRRLSGVVSITNGIKIGRHAPKC